MHATVTTAPNLRDRLERFVPAGAAASRRTAPLDAVRILRDAVLVMALMALNTAGTAGSIAFFVILAIMLLRSPEAAFKALAICYLALMINKAFVPKSLFWTPARLVLPYLALIRFSADLSTLRYSITRRSSYLCLVAFVATMAVCSIASGWYTHIALLKALNFLVYLTTIFAGTAVLRLRRSDIGEWFVSLILAATLFGIAAVLLRQGNNFRNIVLASGEVISNMGFNGAFLHPNSHATYATLFVAFLAIVWIISRYRRSWLTAPIIACWLVFMSWSGSRTSFIASIVAMLVLMAYARPMRNRLGWYLRPKIRRGTLIAVVVLAFVGTLIVDAGLGGSLRSTVVGFINKSQAGSELGGLDADKIVASRKALIEFSWLNFKENPIFGIGFGVAKTEEFRRTATLFTAPAEKGFLPTAILEEGGVLGTAAFIVFLIAFIGELMRDRNVAGLVAFATFLATNVGEVTIFAPGGGGAFGWITVGAAIVLGDRCWTPARHSGPTMTGQR